MNTKIKCGLTIFIFQLITHVSYCQNVTIIYNGSSLCNATTCCNTFWSSSNPVVNGIRHYPISGGATFDLVAIKMQSTKNPFTSTDNGTAYAIGYDFKVGYTYTVTLDVGYTSNPSTQPPTVTASLWELFPNPNSTNPSPCGPVSSSYYLNSINFNFIIGSFLPSQTAVKPYPLAQFTTSFVKHYMCITVWQGAQNGSTVSIPKITITEVANGPSCPANVTISGNYNTALTQSQTWIASSGQTTILNSATVKLDADPVNGYVVLSPASKFDYFLSEPVSSGVFIAQPLDGCGPGIPTKPGTEKVTAESMAEFSKSPPGLRLYPNPAKEFIIVTSENQLTDALLQLFDLNGKAVKTTITTINGYSKKLAFRGMAPGLYILKISGKKTNHSAKIIIN
ncbi:MAG TPA: T9SS type A sorting domain-containing protein [Ferruginibacter sp.]|nr:T9SS type A sorting domain-containing protein [Ferruginibacter sp.]